MKEKKTLFGKHVYSHTWFLWDNIAAHIPQHSLQISIVHRHMSFTPIFTTISLWKRKTNAFSHLCTDGTHLAVDPLSLTLPFGNALQVSYARYRCCGVGSAAEQGLHFLLLCHS